MVGEFDAVTSKFRITRNRSRTSNYYDACQYLQYYYNNQPIPPSNIAKGKTSQVITSRHFSSLLFTSSFYNTHTHIQQLKISLHFSSFLTLTFGPCLSWDSQKVPKMTHIAKFGHQGVPLSQIQVQTC